MPLELFTITNATKKDAASILALYRANLYGAADWSEDYPSMETIEFDLSRDSLFVMKNGYGEILAVISIDSDEEVEKLSCWSKELAPGGELSRLCVREDVCNHGIARKMMEHAFGVLRIRGFKSVHILVRKGHEVALKSYAHLKFTQVGECELFDKEFVCLERPL